MPSLVLRNRSISYICALMLVSSPAATPVYAQEGAAGGLKITILEGNDAIANVRQRVSREAIIQVEDENRKPVGGALVTLMAPNNGASAVFSNGTNTLTTTTDATGRVAVKGIQPNSLAGKFDIRVVASKDGLRGTATMTMTNVATAAVAGGISAKVLAIILTAAAGAAVGGVVATRGGGSSPSAPAQTPVTVSPGTPTVGGPR